MKEFASFALVRAGILAIIAAVNILALSFLPIIENEINFYLHPHPSAVTTNSPSPNYKDLLRPVDSQFGIVIPKIAANSKVVDNVNPYSEVEYQAALTHGVAHAKNTAYPGQSGNIFIFAHSAVNFWEASRYNSVFYLLSKLAPGDKVYLFYKDQTYVYGVLSTKIVSPSEVSYLSGSSSSRQLTLMTCWPAGINYKRLLVFAELVAG